MQGQRARRVFEEVIFEDLFGEIHAPQEVLEAGVGAERVKSVRRLEVNHPAGAYAITFLKPLQRLFLLSQSGVDESREHRVHILFGG